MWEAQPREEAVLHRELPLLTMSISMMRKMPHCVCSRVHATHLHTEGPHKCEVSEPKASEQRLRTEEGITDIRVGAFAGEGHPKDNWQWQNWEMTSTQEIDQTGKYVRDTKKFIFQRREL